MSGTRQRHGGWERERLLALFGRLDAPGRAMLLDFAELLAAPTAPASTARVVPLRSTAETVLQAVRRLNATYPGLDRAKLIVPVGALLSQHLVEERDAGAVIDDLEALYRAAFGASTPRWG